MPRTKILTMQPGDTVTVAIPDHMREGGYNPLADGEAVKVLGYATIYYGRTSNHGNEPGLYLNTSWVNVQDARGNQHHINSSFVSPLPGASKVEVPQTSLRVGNLPETTFWETDEVVAPSGERLKVLGIDYESIGGFCRDGVTPLPIYRCGEDHGMYTYFREDALVLADRGNVWKRSHGEEPRFESVQEEAQFYHEVGETDYLRNPSTDGYKWTEDEALSALEEGLGHGLSTGTAWSPGSILVLRFRDEDVGERVRAATLEDFGRSPAPPTPGFG